MCTGDTPANIKSHFEFLSYLFFVIIFSTQPKDMTNIEMDSAKTVQIYQEIRVIALEHNV